MTNERRPSDLLTQPSRDSQAAGEGCLRFLSGPDLPGDVFYAQEDEEKIAYLAPIEAYIYYYYHVQSPQDSAVKAWLIDPYT